MSQNIENEASMDRNDESGTLDEIYDYDKPKENEETQKENSKYENQTLMTEALNVYAADDDEQQVEGKNEEINSKNEENKNENREEKEKEGNEQEGEKQEEEETNNETEETEKNPNLCDQETSIKSKESFPPTPEETPTPLTGITVKDDILDPADLVPNAAKRVEIDDLPLLTTPPNVERMCLDLIEQFQKTKKLPNLNKVTELLQYLQRQKVNCLQQSKYKEAHNYDVLYEEITTYVEKIEITGTNEKKIKTMESKIKDVEEELTRAQEEVEYEVQQQTKAKEAKIKKLEEQQQVELEQFEEKWNDENFLRKFEKPSNKLLQLITIERSLVQSGKYEDAESIRTQIEELEIAESEAAQERARNEMTLQQSKILTKHEREKEQVEVSCDLFIERSRMLKQNEADLIAERLTRMQKNLDVFKMNLKKLPPLKSQKKQDTVLTPRTQKRMSLCKQAVRSPHISVKPLGKIKTTTKKKVKPLSPQTAEN